MVWVWKRGPKNQRKVGNHNSTCNSAYRGERTSGKPIKGHTLGLRFHFSYPTLPEKITHPTRKKKRRPDMRIILTSRGSSEVYRANRTQSTKFHLRHLSFPFEHMKMRCIHPRSLAAHLPQNSHHHPKWKESSSNLQPSLCG